VCAAALPGCPPGLSRKSCSLAKKDFVRSEKGARMLHFSQVTPAPASGEHNEKPQQ